MESLMDNYHRVGKFNGSVLVAKKGKVLLAKGYGLANMSWQVKNQVNTRFYIASVTKQFTASLILKLAQEGKLNLKTHIAHYLPDYPRSIGSKVNLHQLLNHTSGLPDVFQVKGFREVLASNPYDIDTFIHRFCAQPLLFEPGTGFRYSNAGYTILGRIIEKVTQMRFSAALEAYLFRPLGMKNTGYVADEPFVSQLANGYKQTLTGYTNAAYQDMTVPFSAGGVYSTVEDMHIWDRALYTDKLLNKVYKRLLYTSSAHRNYAYGWEIDSLTLNTTSLLQYHHSGGIPGYSAKISRFPQGQYLVVLMNNTGGAPLSQITKDIMSVLHGIPVAKPEEELENRVYTRLVNKGAPAAIELLTEEEAIHGARSERWLNVMGYALLEVGEENAAIAFFTLNAQRHPQSSNAYDSLGEAYLKTGNKTQAKKAYQKALVLDAENQSARAALASIKIGES